MYFLKIRKIIIITETNSCSTIQLHFTLEKVYINLTNIPNQFKEFPVLLDN